MKNSVPPGMVPPTFIAAWLVDPTGVINCTEAEWKPPAQARLYCPCRARGNNALGDELARDVRSTAAIDQLQDSAATHALIADPRGDKTIGIVDLETRRETATGGFARDA